MIRSITRPKTVVGGIVLLLGVLAMFGITALNGTKTGAALAIATVLGPVAAYGAIVAPLLFPFSAYIVLAPFDNLLRMEAFGTVTRLFAMVCGASLVLWLIRKRGLIAPDRALVFWFGYALWCAVSMMWAIDPSFSYAHIFTFAQLLALYAAVSFMPVDRRTLGYVLIAVIASGALAAGYGYVVFRHSTEIAANITANVNADRLVLQNDNDKVDPNQFAASLLLPAALGLMVFLRTKSPIVWSAATAALAVIGLGIAISGSRGSLLALVATVLYIVLRLRTRVLAAGVAVAGLASALAVSGSLIQRFAIAESTGGAGRLDIWKVGLNAFRAHFWFGAGYANFPLAFDQSFLTVNEHRYTFWHRAPHDILLSAAVELGVIGLLLLLVTYVVQFRAMQGIGRADPLFGARVAVEGALIGLFVAGLFLDILTTKYFWVALMVAMLVRNAGYTPQREHLQYARGLSPLLPSVDRR